MKSWRQALLTVVAAALGCGGGSLPQPVAQSPARQPEEIRPVVDHFCGNCHETPRPDSFPRDQWPHEVERGYEFYLMSGRTDLAIPLRADVLAYYQQLAPERLAIEPGGNLAVTSNRFQRQDRSWPKPSDELIAIAHVQLGVMTDGATLPELVLCDMKGGAVTWAAVAGDRFHIQREVKLDNPAHVCRTDLDADGNPDYLVCDLGSFLPEDHKRGRVVWLRPRGDDPAADFEQIVLLDGVGRVADAQPADFDGDGDLDVVVAVFGWHTTGSVMLLRQQPARDGRPQFAAEVLDDREGAIHVPVADLNGDGRPDFVALFSQEHESVEAFTSREDGKFHKQVIYRAPDPSYGSSGIELVDFDGDGDLDVLYTNGDTFDSFYVKPYHSVRWIENQGSGVWKDHLLANLPGAHRARAADLDGDADLDVAVCCFVSTLSTERQPEVKHLVSIAWLERQGDRFVLHEIEANDPVHACLELADVNGDGAIDLVVGNFGEFTQERPAPVTVWLNRRRP